MIDKAIENEILSYTFSADKQKFIPGRCAVAVLEKRGWLNYLKQRYTSNSTESVIEILYRIKNNLDNVPKCKICGKSLIFVNGSYPNYCSAKCRNNDPEVIAKNKFGVSKSLKCAYLEHGNSIKNKRAKTLETKYGVSNSSSPFSYKEIREKAKNSIIERYGVDNVMKLPEFHSNTKETFRKLSTQLWKERGLDIEYTDHDTVIIKNGCNIHGDIEMDISTFNNRTKAERINVSEICPVCNPLHHNSGKEIFLMKFFDELGIKYNVNDRTVIKPLELDFYFKEYNLAIEINGTYFHGEYSSKPKDYHLHKTELCEEKGIQLIHIWEDDLVNKKDIVLSMLKNKFRKNNIKISARSCVVKNVSAADATLFLNNNHLQGAINSKYKFGLYYNDELVSLMTFGKLRASLGTKSNNSTCELYRFCNKLGVTVIGGASKLFKHAVNVLKNDNILDIITYAKRDWSTGNLYKKLGFTFIKYTEPGYFWTNSRGKRYNRYSFRKSEIAKTEEEKEMTEVEIMHKRGYYRCYDSGNLKFHFSTY